MVAAIESFAERDVAYHLHPFTDLKQHEADGPAIISRGEGVYLFDSAGRRYLDGMSSLWCCTLGYDEPRLVQAAQEQMSRLPYSHSFRGRSHETLIALAETLVALAPGPMSKAFFAGSGSEANETAVKLAWYYNRARGKPAKRKIISRHGAYHGSTIFAAGLSGLPAMHSFLGAPLSEIRYVACPHHYAGARPDEDEASFAARLAAELAQTIEAEGPETVAAFIAEPVMGVGGVILPPAGYFEQVQAVLRAHDVLLIADEVVCGFGRTGALFGSTTFAMQPDILTVAKGVTSAYFPLSAAVVSEPIYRALVAESESNGLFSHGFTYSGHPVGAAVALEAIRIYRERDIVGQVRAVAPLLQGKLRALADRPLVGEVRGVGLMAAVQLVEDKASKRAFAPELKVGARVMEQAEREGLFVRAVGDSLIIAPPLIIEEGEVTELVARFERALDATTVALRR